MSNSHPILLAITGASGAAYAMRLLSVLANTESPVDLVVSDAGRAVVRQELDIELPEIGNGKGVTAFPNVRWHAPSDLFASIASGSHITRGMVICPCSSRTLGAIASGMGDNLIHRAADVHLKERRPLILVPRETPVSLIHLDNLRTLATAGAMILPASPGFYHRPETIDDLVDFLVARICDAIDIPHDLAPRWGDGA